jgi:hypothetical protein
MRGFIGSVVYKGAVPFLTSKLYRSVKKRHCEETVPVISDRHIALLFKQLLASSVWPEKCSLFIGSDSVLRVQPKAHETETEQMDIKNGSILEFNMFNWNDLQIKL